MDNVLNWTDTIGIVSIPVTCNHIIGVSEPTFTDDGNIGNSTLTGNIESINSIARPDTMNHNAKIWTLQLLIIFWM